MAEKIPGWVKRLLIPTLESRVRTVVKEELGHFEKVMDARFQGVEARFDGVEARFDSVNAKIDSLEKRLNVVEDIVDIKARLAMVEKRASA